MGWWSKIRATVAAVVVGVATGGLSLIAGVVTIASAVYIDRQQQKAEDRMRAQFAEQALQGISVMTKEPAQARRIVYGKDVKIAGNIVFAHVPAAAANTLYLVIVLADHELNYSNSSYTVYIEDTKLDSSDFTTSGYWENVNNGTYQDKFKISWHTKGLLVDEGLFDEIPTEWTFYHRLIDIAYITCKLTFDVAVYPAGLPNISVRCDGLKCLDPRDSTWKHTSNPALMVYNHLTNTQYGLGIAAADIDTSASELQAQADICDQAVGAETRYECFGVFPLDMTPNEILNKLLDSCAGQLLKVGEKFLIRVGAWRASTMTLDEGDIRGPIEVTTKRRRRDVFNRVQGIFLDSLTDQPANYPALSNSTYITADGEVVPLQLDLTTVKQSGQAQRIASIVMQKNRREISTNLAASGKALKLIAGDTVALTVSRMGWSAKTFQVVQLEITEHDGELLIPLALQEIDSTVYSDPTEATYQPSTASNLPSAYTVANVTNLVATESLKAFGDVVGNLVTLTWTAAASMAVTEYQIAYQLSAGGTWTDVGNVPAVENRVEIRLDDAANYDFRVKSKNLMGSVSTGTTITNQAMYGKTAAPSDVTNLAVSIEGDKIRLTWDAVSDLDLFEYEVQLDGSDWDTGSSVVGRFKVTDTLVDPIAAGAHTYRIKAVDTSNIESTNQDTDAITIAAPDQPTVSYTVTGTTIDLSWTDVKNANGFPIENYKIRQGASWAAGAAVAETKSLELQISAGASGSYTYFVKGFDSAGNESGTAGSSGAITISDPSDPINNGSFVDKAIVNLIWTDSKTSYEISQYEIRRGSVFADATIIGYSKTTIENIVEQEPGTYTYHVTAYDIAGNSSSYFTVELTTLYPAGIGYVQTVTDSFSGTKAQCQKETIGGVDYLFAPVISTESWAVHFTKLGFDTIQDFIDAGYDYYYQPGASIVDGGDLTSSCYYFPVQINWGVNMTYLGVPGVKIKADFDRKIIDAGASGIVSFVPWITLVGVDNDGDPYSESFTNWEASISTTFRYVDQINLYLYMFATGTDHMIRLTNMRTVISYPIVSESGVSDVSAHPTNVLLTKPFSNMESVTATYNGASNLNPVTYNFSNDASSVTFPARFAGDLFDNTNAASTGRYSYTATGF